MRRGDNIPPVSDYDYWDEDWEEEEEDTPKLKELLTTPTVFDDIPPLKRFRLGIILEIEAAHIEQAAHIFYHKLQDESINYREELR